MENREHLHIRRMLIIGLIASVVTVVGGELPIGWTAYPPADNYIASMVLACANLSMVQLACGVLFGGVAIPLQYYGFEAVSKLVWQGGSERCARLIHWGALACAFLGGIVHVICVALMFVCKTLGDQSLVVMPQPAIDFTLYLVMPICVVFMPVYYAMTVAMLIAVGKGRTVFPRWAAVFNPLTAALILNVLPMFAPNTALVNALNMANMGVGSVITFGGMLLLLGHDGAKA